MCRLYLIEVHLLHNTNSFHNNNTERIKLRPDGDMEPYMYKLHIQIHSGSRFPRKESDPNLDPEHMDPTLDPSR